VEKVLGSSLLFQSKDDFFKIYIMSKYRGPRLRIVRRLGRLPALTQKIPKRNSKPGHHGENPKKITRFASRLLEKQRFRFQYGISERKLIRYVKISQAIKGSTGRVLLKNLEMRLDNIVFRLGWARTLPAARQIVSHGHILVNKQRIKIPSFSCSPGQLITVGRAHQVRRITKQNFGKSIQNIPSHLFRNRADLVAIVNCEVDYREVQKGLNELSVVEYYSNRILIKSVELYSNFC